MTDRYDARFDRESVESVHDFEDKCASAEELETIAQIEAEEAALEVLSQAIKQEQDVLFNMLLTDWQKRLQGIKVNADTEMLIQQLRKNGLV
jgi:hypothetical protein